MIKRIAALSVSLLLILTGSLLAGASPALAAVSYYYAGGHQNFTGTLPTYIIANVTVHAPALDTSKDYHTLAELAIEKDVDNTSDGVTNPTRNIVEVGWTVDNIVFGDTNPHLWVGRWVNGVFGGYNTGFVNCNSCVAGQPDNWDAGDTLTAGTTMRMGAQYCSTGCTAGWWVWAYINGATAEWLGYFPATTWTGATPAVTTFTDGAQVHAFGEMATETSLGGPGCTDEGDGNFASAGPPATGALISSVTLGGIATGSVNITAVSVVTDPTKFNKVDLGTPGNIRSFRYGGPGAC